MTDALPPLISLNPSNSLAFHLSRTTQAKTILTVKNVSDHKVVFKVKTTMPSWYFVRPNQHILEPEQSEDVSILLVDTECQRFLDNLGTNNEEKVDKHRFLVQSKVITDSEHEHIMALPAAQRVEEMSKLWDGSKEDRRNVKLKVSFTYQEVTQATAAGGGSEGNSSAEALRNKLSRDPSLSGVNPAGRATAGVDPVAEDETQHEPGSKAALEADLAGLRKRYDAVVVYTVHLTAERDAIIAQLETAQKDLVREKAKAKKGSDSSQRDKGAEKVSKKESGFGLISVFLAALIFFLLGKYFA